MATRPPIGRPPHSAAQKRTIAVALDLFGERGVRATSLQLIADTLGVTKAAVYHQFKTKEAIVIAAAEMELELLEAAVDRADAAGRTTVAREVLLGFVIDMAVKRRGAVATLQSDPEMVGFLAGHEPFQLLMDRLFTALLGDETGSWPRMQAAILSAAIGGAVVHPFVADMADATLKAELLAVTRRLIALPD